MASPRESPSQREDGVDDWTIVHHRVSEMIENGGMSDISLPPLPPFGASESGSQVDGSDQEEALKPENNQQPTTANDWSGSSAEPEASGEDDDDGSCEGGEEEKSSNVPHGREMSRSSRRRVGAAGSTSSRRRPSARARSAASMGEVGGADSGSSRSVSPAGRPRRRAARIERGGRRLDERPPPVQSESGSSSSAAFSSPCPSPTRSSPTPRGLLSSSLVRLSRNSVEAGGGRDGNGLIPFSLEDVTTIDPSETLSETSSPFRTGDLGHRWRQNPPGGHPMPVRSVSGSSSIAAAADAANARTTDADTGRGTSEIDRASLASRVNEGAGAGDGGASMHCVRNDSNLLNLGESNATNKSVLPNNNDGDGVGFGSDGIGGGRGRFYSASESHLSNSNLSTNYSSSVPVSADGFAAGSGEGAEREQAIFSTSGGEADRCSGLVVVRTTTTAERAAPAAAATAGTATTLRINTTREGRTEPGARSICSAAGGGRAGTTGPFGRLFSGTGGGVVGGEWGVASTGVGRTGSVLGFSGFKMAVLEARAEAAEEQGEFWQGRAMVAEAEKGRMEKIVAKQAARITELLEYISGSGRDSSLHSQSSGCPPWSTPLPHRFDTTGNVESSSTISSNNKNNNCGSSSGSGGKDDDGNRQEIIVDNSIEGGVNAADMVAGRHERTPSAADDGEQASLGIGGGIDDRAVEDDTQEKDVEARPDAEGEEEKKRRGILERVGGIAFTSFFVGRVAMFFPTPEGNFLAFNVGCPGHFLSKESQALVGRDDHFRPYYILGRIIEIQEVTCGDSNPFKLPNGQRIRVVSVETISPELREAGLQLESRDI